MNEFSAKAHLIYYHLEWAKAQSNWTRFISNYPSLFESNIYYHWPIIFSSSHWMHTAKSL